MNVHCRHDKQWDMLDVTRFAKVLALAGSDVDGEALAAVRKAGKMLQAANLSFTDIAQSLGSGAIIEGGGDELARLRLRLADADRLIRAYQKEVAKLRAERPTPPGGSPRRTRAEIAATMRSIFGKFQLAQLSNREIARRTGLSPQAVGNWRRRLEAERVSRRRPVHCGRRRAA